MQQSKMSKQFSVCIANTVIGVSCLYGSTPEYFRRYCTDAAPEYVIQVQPELLEREQQLLNEEADREGLRRRKFTDFFLERTVIMRQTAACLLEKDVLLLHGSTVAVDGRAYLFTAKTGVGKSTHTRLWRQVFGDRAVMVNDDRAFLRRTDEGVLAYGSPWSGKHGLDTNFCVPLAGICILERGGENRIAPLSPADALPLLMEQSFIPGDDDFHQVSRLTENLTQNVPLWKMACTKEPEAAKTAYEAMNN